MIKSFKTWFAYDFDFNAQSISNSYLVFKTFFVLLFQHSSSKPLQAGLWFGGRKGGWWWLRPGIQAEESYRQTWEQWEDSDPDTCPSHQSGKPSRPRTGNISWQPLSTAACNPPCALDNAVADQHRHCAWHNANHNASATIIETHSWRIEW